MNWFRRAKPANPIAGDWTCAGCGEIHQGMMDLAAFAPDPWPHDLIQEPNSAVRLDGDFLSEDFCVIGGSHFFVRAALRIPVHGLSDALGFGCWSTLSRTSFEWRDLPEYVTSPVAANRSWSAKHSRTLISDIFVRL